MRHPQARPGGRSEQVAHRVLDAAREIADSDEAELSVGTIAAQAGVSEVTIYRRWGNADNVLLDAAVADTTRRLPLAPTGDLRRDLTRWARNAERSIRSRPGRRLALAALRAQSDDDGAEAVRQFVGLRIAQVQAVLDAADPPTTLTAERVLDEVLAPLYLRMMFGYTRRRTTPAALVAAMIERADGHA